MTAWAIIVAMGLIYALGCFSAGALLYDLWRWLKGGRQ